MARTILTDIEGTVGSIAFVRRVLFPYARRALPGFVAEHGRQAGVRHWLDAVAGQTGATDDAAIVATLQGWIDQDRKHTALKALQGLIWEAGYRSSDFTAPIYPDAAAALRRWHAEGHRLAVYSSASVPAQQLFFGHSDAGDLSGLFTDWFDTEAGGKREAASYARIVGRLGVPAAAVLFLSDVVAELDAAREAGLGTILLDRREDYPQPRLGKAAGGHMRVEDFSAITA